MNKKLLIALALFGATYAQAQSIRLIGRAGHAYQNGVFNLQDSTYYRYSFGRSLVEAPSFYQNGTWAADDMISQSWDAGTQQYTNVNMGAYQFDSDDRVTASYNGLWENNLNIWDTAARYTYEFANDQVSTVHYDTKVSGNWIPGSRSIHTYGPDGLISTLTQTWDATLGTYLDLNLSTNSYVSGQLVQSQGEHWDGTNWIPTSRSTNSYNGNVLVSILYEVYNGGWGNTQNTVYTYDNDDNIIKYENFSWNNNAWMLTSRQELTFDNDHTPLSMEYYFWDGSQLSPAFRFDLEYNTDNYISRHVRKSVYTNGQFEIGNGDYESLFYYEEFDPSSTGNTVKNNTALQVFPNPASNTLNIRSFAAQDKPFSITIFDATGRSVKHWNEAPTTFYQKQVDVADLPSGNYFLRISDKPQEAVQFTILK